MNPDASKSRLHAPTADGYRLQTKARRQFGLTAAQPFSPHIDWERYGYACFSHREAIISVLTQPLTAADIKRRIRKRFAEVRVSCNNIRDALRLLQAKDVVRKIVTAGDHRPRYELTEPCSMFPGILNDARWASEEPLVWRQD